MWFTLCQVPYKLGIWALSHKLLISKTLTCHILMFFVQWLWRLTWTHDWYGILQLKWGRNTTCLNGIISTYFVNEFYTNSTCINMNCTAIVASTCIARLLLYPLPLKCLIQTYWMSDVHEDGSIVYHISWKMHSELTLLS